MGSKKGVRGKDKDKRKRKRKRRNKGNVKASGNEVDRIYQMKANGKRIEDYGMS